MTAPVIPAKAGIQSGDGQEALDPRLRGDDAMSWRVVQ